MRALWNQLTIEGKLYVTWLAYALICGVAVILTGCVQQVPVSQKELEFRACHMSVLGEDDQSLQVLLMCDKPTIVKQEKHGS